MPDLDVNDLRIPTRIRTIKAEKAEQETFAGYKTYEEAIHALCYPDGQKTKRSAGYLRTQLKDKRKRLYSPYDRYVLSFSYNT
jgi:hypothetical protein